MDTVKRTPSLTPHCETANSHRESRSTSARSWRSPSNSRLGVDIIEAGFPVASQGDFEAVEAIAKSVRGPTIAGLSHGVQGRRPGLGSGPARRQTARRIHVSATSKIHMEKKLRMTPEQVKAEAAAASRARSYTDDVEFSPEDGYRSDPDFMCEVCPDRGRQRATTVNIPDTVGFACPSTTETDPLRDRHGERRLRRLDPVTTTSDSPSRTRSRASPTRRGRSSVR